MNVPVHGHIVGEPERANLMEVVNSDWYTAGKWCAKFQAALQEYLGTPGTFIDDFGKTQNYLYCPHVILCNSGSSANLLAIAALTSQELGDRRILPGDEVITTAVNFPTTVNPIIQMGAIPVFIDVVLPQMNADVTQLEAALSDKTKAVVLCHTLGYPFDLEAVQAFCTAHNLWLIEDCCDALGGTYYGKSIGTLGDLATYSFYPAHQISTGEGGAVATRDPQLAKLIRSYRDWGRDCWCDAGHDNTCGRRWSSDYDHKHTYSRIGYSLKMTDFQGAIGAAQMKRLPGFIEARLHNHAYLHSLAHEYKLDEYFMLPKIPLDRNPSWFGYALICKEGIDRNKLCQFLDKRKIGVRPMFGGNLLRQPAYADIQSRTAANLINSNIVHDSAFWIGCWPGLTNNQLEYAMDMIYEYCLFKGELYE